MNGGCIYMNSSEEVQSWILAQTMRWSKLSFAPNERGITGMWVGLCMTEH